MCILENIEEFWILLQAFKTRQHSICQASFKAMFFLDSLECFSHWSACPIHNYCFNNGWTFNANLRVSNRPKHSFLGTGLNPVPARLARGSAEVRILARGSSARGLFEGKLGCFRFQALLKQIFEHKNRLPSEKNPKFSACGGQKT